MVKPRPETALRVTDHALLRFLERAGGFDSEGIRAAIGASLLRAEQFASVVGNANYEVRADGLRYVVRNSVLVTVLPDGPPLDPARQIKVQVAGN